MTRETKPIHKIQMTEGKRNITRLFLEKYYMKPSQDIQDTLKDLPSNISH